MRNYIFLVIVAVTAGCHSKNEPPPANAVAKPVATDRAVWPPDLVKMVLTLNNDDPRYRGATTLSGVEPPPEVAKDLRMSVYPAVLTADGALLAYLHVRRDGPLELRMFRPGAPPKVLLTFDDQNNGSPRLTWSPNGTRLALVELRHAPDDNRHSTTRLTVLDVSAGGDVTGRFERPINAFFQAGEENLVAPVWKDNETVSYESKTDGARGPSVDVRIK